MKLNYDLFGSWAYDMTFVACRKQDEPIVWKILNILWFNVLQCLPLLTKILLTAFFFPFCQPVWVSDKDNRLATCEVDFLSQGLAPYSCLTR